MDIVYNFKIFIMAKHVLSIALIALTFIGCNQSKEALKQAEQYSSAGMHVDAFNRYVSIYRNNPKLIEAHIGAKSTGNFLVLRNFAEVNMLMASGNYESALNALDVAEQFYHENQWLNLERPPLRNASRTEIRQSIADNYFAQAVKASEDENWEAVQMYLLKVFRYDPKHREGQYLEMMAQLVPDYRRGLKAMDLGMYQEAIAYFEIVINKDAGFANAMSLYNECIEASQFTMAFIHVNENRIDDKYNECLEGYVHEEILQTENPFITLVSRQHLDHLLEEQLLSMGGIINEESLIEAGNLLGAEFLLIGEIKGIEADESADNRRNPFSSQGGFSGLTKSKDRNARERTLRVVYKFQLINAETGQIAVAKTLPFEHTGSIEWTSLKDKLTSLPAMWEEALFDEILSLTNGGVFKREIKDKKSNGLDKLSEEQQLELFFEYVAESIAHEIDAFSKHRRIER
ncbi:MAG: tetratricopeptide (TPR) repeat protein [Flavobacteriales bacterium]|jgi:tetratricopeptide (TPR) repeat protein